MSWQASELICHINIIGNIHCRRRHLVRDMRRRYRLIDKRLNPIAAPQQLSDTP